MIDTTEVTKAALQDVAKVSKGNDVSIPQVKRREWAAASLLLCLSIAGFVAGRLGYIWPGFDVFSHLSVQFLFGAFAFAIALFFAKRLTTTVGFILAMLFCAGYGATAYQATPKSFLKLDIEGAFSVLTYNIYKNNKNFDGIVKSIKDANADIIFIIEIVKENEDVLKSIELLYPYKSKCAGWTTCRHLVFSRFPIKDSKFDYDNNIVQANITLPTGEVTVVGAHLTRFPHTRVQLEQAQQLSKALEKLPKPLIVAGDFNATPFSRIVDIIISQNNLTRLTSTPTWPATIGFPQLAIDHIFVSSGIEKLSGPYAGDAGGSDHLPVFVTLRLTPKVK